MDFVLILQTITQFHEILDKLLEKQTQNNAILEKLEKALELVVAKTDDLGNRLGVFDKLSDVRERLNKLIAGEKVVSSRPSV